MMASQTAREPGAGLGDEDVARRLRALVDRLAARKRVPHAVVGVARGDGSFRWVGAAGAATGGGTPMRADTPYCIASVTKLFIATAVLQLREEVMVDLDAPAASYLPDGTVAGLHRLDGVDHTPRITVRNLLSHTSGLPDYLEDRPTGGRSWYEELSEGADRSWEFPDVVRRTRDLRPHFPPQDLGAARCKARYSDTNFQLLIAIIEAVTSQPFHQVLDQRLFRPLELRHTWLPGRSQPLDPALPAPAGLWAKARPLEIPGALASFNDLMSTADDTLRFLNALTRGKVFTDPATHHLMQQRWNRVFSPIRYGLGIMRFRVARLFAPGRRPVTLIGHSGSTGSWLFHCPELDLLLTGTVDETNARALPFRFSPRVLRACRR